MKKNYSLYLSLDYDALVDALKKSSMETSTHFRYFSFNGKQYNLLKVDILAGIYKDSEAEITVRPTPGLFLQTLPNPEDPSVPFGDIIFLPGVFNPASDGPSCPSTSIFLAGVWSHPVNCYSISNLKNDPTIYLNKFDAMKLPFDLNQFLTPVDIKPSSKIDPDWISYPLFTPLDFAEPTDIKFITSNAKFMSNLFSADQRSNTLRQANDNKVEALNRVISQQRQLDQVNLATTLIMSNPTNLATNYRDKMECGCFNSERLLTNLYNPAGIQFYDLSAPTNDVSILPFILYDKSGNPISSVVLKAAIGKYCSGYQSRRIRLFLTE